MCCLWGKAEDGGKNFSGLVGDLFNGYTDVAWAQLFFTLERSRFIDYTDAYMFDYGGFMVSESIPFRYHLTITMRSCSSENQNPFLSG